MKVLLPVLFLLCLPAKTAAQQQHTIQTPIIIIDGLEIPYDMLTRFDASLIERMDALTKDNATYEYGDRGTAGVIKLTLKEPYPLVTLNGTELPEGSRLKDLKTGPLLSITGLKPEDARGRFGGIVHKPGAPIV